MTEHINYVAPPRRGDDYRRLVQGPWAGSGLGLQAGEVIEYRRRASVWNFIAQFAVIAGAIGFAVLALVLIGGW